MCEPWEGATFCSMTDTHQSSLSLRRENIFFLECLPNPAVAGGFCSCVFAMQNGIYCQSQIFFPFSFKDYFKTIKYWKIVKKKKVNVRAAGPISWGHDQNYLFLKKASSSSSYGRWHVGNALSHRVSTDLVTNVGNVLTQNERHCCPLSMAKGHQEGLVLLLPFPLLCPHSLHTAFCPTARRSGSSCTVAKALGSGAKWSGLTCGFPMCPRAKYRAVLGLGASPVEQR